MWYQVGLRQRYFLKDPISKWRRVCTISVEILVFFPPNSISLFSSKEACPPFLILIL